jgi:K+-transporting ATPase KdpF subunit
MTVLLVVGAALATLLLGYLGLALLFPDQLS